MIALLLFGSMAVFMALGVPIAFALGAASMILFFVMGVPVSGLSQRLFTSLDSFSIMAIPFFVLAGNLMTKGGISKRLVGFSNSVIGNVRGGMAIGAVISCAFFAALSGSAPATVMAIGGTLYPEMVKLGYPKDRSAGLMAVSGGLGPIIPPSIVMVVYGTITESSVGDLFKAGAFWGVLLAVILILVCLIYARKENWPKNEEKTTLKDFGRSFLGAIPAMIMPLIILGGIYSGYFTPTEAAGVAVIYAMIAGLFIYREISFKDLLPIFRDSAKGSAIVLFIIATSSAFGWLFTFTGISGQLVGFIDSLNLSKFAFLAIIGLVLFMFGFFMEGLATVVLLVPVLFPIATSLGIHPIHFGMLVAVANVVGCMTPPVAVNLFSAASISGRPIEKVAKGEMPFFVAMLLVYLAVVFLPGLTTMLL